MLGFVWFSSVCTCRPCSAFYSVNERNSRATVEGSLPPVRSQLSGEIIKVLTNCSLQEDIMYCTTGIITLSCKLSQLILYLNGRYKFSCLQVISFKFDYLYGPQNLVSKTAWRSWCYLVHLNCCGQGWRSRGDRGILSHFLLSLQFLGLSTSQSLIFHI